MQSFLRTCLELAIAGGLGERSNRADGTYENTNLVISDGNLHITEYDDYLAQRMGSGARIVAITARW